MIGQTNNQTNRKKDFKCIDAEVLFFYRTDKWLMTHHESLFWGKYARIPGFS